MTYTQKINEVYNKYVKDFKRKDTTFDMMVIRNIVSELESGKYNNEEYTEENIDIICKYLSQRYLDDMYNRYKYLNSEEYKNRYKVL